MRQFSLPGVQTIEKPELHHQIKIDMAEFRKGLLKIAYELAFIWLGESYLDDPMAAKLRDVILSRSDEKTAGLRGTNGDWHRLSSLSGFGLRIRIAMSLTTPSLGNDIAVCLKIFDVFCGSHRQRTEGPVCNRPVRREGDTIHLFGPSVGNQSAMLVHRGDGAARRSGGKAVALNRLCERFANGLRGQANSDRIRLASNFAARDICNSRQRAV